MKSAATDIAGFRCLIFWNTKRSGHARHLFFTVCFLLVGMSVWENSVRMNSNSSSSGMPRPRFDFREDLSRSRDLTRREIDAYGYVLGWMEDWRVRKDLPAGREAARAWWREVAKAKERPEWQLRQPTLCGIMRSPRISSGEERTFGHSRNCWGIRM